MTGRPRGRQVAAEDPLGEDPELRRLAGLIPGGAPGPGAPVSSAGLPAAATPTPPADLAVQADPGPAEPPLAAATTTRDLRPVADLPERDIATEDHTIQAAVAVSMDVAARFRRLQRRLGANGPKPFNGDIIFAALNASAGRFHEIVAAHKPQAQPGQMFGAPMAGRRRNPEAQPGLTLSFRPSRAEKAEIERLVTDTDADSMSALIDAVLDDYLTAQGHPPTRTTART